MRAELNLLKDDGNVSWDTAPPPPWRRVVVVVKESIRWGIVVGEYGIFRFEGEKGGNGEWDGEELAAEGSAGGGEGGAGGLETAGQHQELSGETTVGVSSLRLWWLLSAKYEVEEWSDVAAAAGVEVEVVIVVSRQRRRFGLMGWVWNLSWVVVAAI